MAEIKITEKISYIPGSSEPLSAEIAIVRDLDRVWLFDVGCGDKVIEGLSGEYNIVISHFHADHLSNLGKIREQELYVSKHTFGYTHRGTIVENETLIGNVKVFTFPATHAKGCLGMEVDKEYAFLGDGLYGKRTDKGLMYNSQLVKAQIDLLKTLDADKIFLSHEFDKIRSKNVLIRFLEGIYSKRDKNSSEIYINSEEHDL